MDGFELEGDSVDDEQLRQLEELTKNLQKSVANIKANRGKENWKFLKSILHNQLTI